MDALNKNFPVGQPSATGGYEWMQVRASGGGHKLVGESDTDYTAFPDDFPPNRGGISTSGQSLFGLQLLNYNPRPGILEAAGAIPSSLTNFTADTSPSGKWLNCDLQMRTIDGQMFFQSATNSGTTNGTKRVYYIQFELLTGLQGFGHSAFSKLQAGIPPGLWTLEDRNIARDIAATYAVDGVNPLSQEYSLPGARCNLQLRAPNDPPDFEQWFDVTGCQVFAYCPTETQVNFICRIFVTGHAGTPGTDTWGTLIGTQPPGIYDLNMHWQVPCPPQDGSMDAYWQFEPIGP